jgi:prepilin-type N-terminal cleavage/methylation domain-containing protein
MKNTKGFTLIELLVVVLIIGILAAIAFPQYQFSVYKSKVASAMDLINKIKDAEELYYLQRGEYTGVLDNLLIGLPSNCVWEDHPDWSYNTIKCTNQKGQLEKQINLNKSYEAVQGYIYGYKNTFCFSYNISYDKNRVPVKGRPGMRNFELNTALSQSDLAFCERVALSFGGKKETDKWSDKYYL